MYTTVDELPTQVLNSLDRHDSGLWLEAYNEALGKGLSVRDSRKAAWHRVEKEPSSFSVYSVATAEIVDITNDLLSMESVARFMDTFIDRGGNVQDLHGNYTVATVWDWAEVTVNEGSPGIAVWYNLFGGGPVYEQARKDFLAGKNSLSVGGKSIDPKKECNEEGCYIRRTMHDLMEISLCWNPDNPLARMISYHEPDPVTDLKKSSDRRLRFTSSVIHKDYTLCPIQDLKKSFRDAGYTDVHARTDGVYLGAPPPGSDTELRGLGFHVVPEKDGLLVNSFDGMLEANFKECLRKGYIRADGSLTPYIPEDRFKELCRKGLCDGGDGRYRMPHPSGGISVK